MELASITSPLNCCGFFIFELRDEEFFFSKLFVVLSWLLICPEMMFWYLLENSVEFCVSISILFVFCDTFWFSFWS